MGEDYFMIRFGGMTSKKIILVLRTDNKPLQKILEMKNFRHLENERGLFHDPFWGNDINKIIPVLRTDNKPLQKILEMKNFRHLEREDYFMIRFGGMTSIKIIPVLRTDNKPLQKILEMKNFRHFLEGFIVAFGNDFF